MAFIVLAAWLVGVIVSLVNGNRKLPLSILGIGVLILGIHFTVGLGMFALMSMAILTIIIWITNKMDMS
jgi:hypothetical protein